MDELHRYTRWKNEGGDCRVHEMGMSKFRERKWVQESEPWM